MALICQKLTATSLLFFFLLFSPLVVASVVVSILPEQRRGEESSRAHLQKGCRWARETRGVLCVCSCLALHTSAKLGSSIRSVVWACWMKWIEREWERVRGTEVFWCFLSGFLLHLSLSFFLHLLPSSPFPRLKQGRESELNHPGVHRSAGLQDAAVPPWNNVSIRSKNKAETEKSPKSNYCAYY